MTGINHFQFNPDKHVLFVFGGSQGSAIINKTVRDCIESLKEKEIQVLWQTGQTNYEELKQFESSGLRIVPFIHEMKEAYAAADLVLCRAGALTLSELTLCGKASILVPLKSAAGDHQFKNARSLEKSGAAKVITEDEIDPVQLSGAVAGLLSDQDEISQMRIQSAKLSKPDAGAEIADQIMQIAQG